MKRNRCCHFCLCVVLLSISWKHADAQHLELKNLNIPDAPALILLDETPSVISRPGTAKAFCASIMSLLSQGDGLPKNFGIEIAPFWLFSNQLNVYKYLGIDTLFKKQENLFTGLRNISFSFGFVKRDSSKMQRYDANFWAAGIKVTPITILRKKMVNSLENVVNSIAARQTILTIPAVTECAPFINQAIYKKCLVKALTNAFSSDKELSIQEERLSQLLAIKPALLVDIAGAGSLVFKDNSFNQRHGHRTSIWTTVAYNLPLSGTRNVEKMIENQNYLNLFLAMRYLAESRTIDFQKFNRIYSMDIGGRIQLEFDRLSVSFEKLRRYSKTFGVKNTNRNVGVIQYKLREHFFLTGSFGKNFGSVNNLVALLGFNWGFGRQSVME